MLLQTAHVLSHANAGTCPHAATAAAWRTLDVAGFDILRAIQPRSFPWQAAGLWSRELSWAFAPGATIPFLYQAGAWPTRLCTCLAGLADGVTPGGAAPAYRGAVGVNASVPRSDPREMICVRRLLSQGLLRLWARDRGLGSWGRGGRRRGEGRRCAGPANHVVRGVGICAALTPRWRLLEYGGGGGRLVCADASSVEVGCPQGGLGRGGCRILGVGPRCELSSRLGEPLAEPCGSPGQPCRGDLVREIWSCPEKSGGWCRDIPHLGAVRRHRHHAGLDESDGALYVPVPRCWFIDFVP